jgi:hypothetical protein
MENNLTIAQTILSQLGGGKFLAMTGAKDLAADKSALRFKLPARFAKDGINFVQITLTTSDLYDMRFGKMAGPSKCFEVSEKASFTGVYFDQLQSVFTLATGLHTRI